MFLIVGRKKNVIRILIMVPFLIILLIALWFYQQKDSQAKVDRSNAIQVSRQVSPEMITSVASLDFFTEYRLERDKIRSERSDLLREFIKNAKTDDARQQAQEAVLKMVLQKQHEAEMESMLKAKGFTDALVFMKDNSASAVVKSSSLSKEDVLQVADVISRVTGIKAEDITISAKP